MLKDHLLIPHPGRIVVIHTIANHASDFDETVFAMNEVAIIPIVHHKGMNEHEHKHKHKHENEDENDHENKDISCNQQYQSLDGNEKRMGKWNSDFPVVLCAQCQPKLEEIEMMIRDEVVNVRTINGIREIKVKEFIFLFLVMKILGILILFIGISVPFTT